MQRRFLKPTVIGSFIICFLNWGCNKFDTTAIGGDLLPVVDNVHTFADTLNVITTQGVFNPDTTVVTRTDDNAVGTMNDPLFGQTNASIYFQLKPTFFPYYLGNQYDTLNGFGCGLDSVVLCLKYKNFYGDSTQPLYLEVHEVLDNKFRDSVNTPNNVNYKPFINPTVVGSTVLNISRIGDTVHYTNNRDSSVNVIRIKLSPLFAAKLYSMDTFYFHTFNNAFYTDSTYRRFYNGLAVLAPGSGNQLVYVNFADPATRIEVHYRRRNNGLPVDTIFSSLPLNSDYYGTVTNRSSNTANCIIRNRPGLTSGSQELSLQTAPGTYANLSIPGLSTLSNRFIHRAELIVQQIPDFTGFAGIFRAPAYLYLDLVDSGTNKWKPIYFDLNTKSAYDPDFLNPITIPYFPAAGVDYLYFGGYRRDGLDKYGNPVNYYNFNLSKYVQDIVTNHRNNYPLRLFSPFKIIYPQYTPQAFGYNNSVAYGRVKVGGGSNPNYRMMLRIIYSNL